jgi:hypothetical protein
MTDDFLPIKQNKLPAARQLQSRKRLLRLLQDFVEAWVLAELVEDWLVLERPIIHPRECLHEFCEALQRPLVVARVDIGVGQPLHSFSVHQSILGNRVLLYGLLAQTHGLFFFPKDELHARQRVSQRTLLVANNGMPQAFL